MKRFYFIALFAFIGIMGAQAQKVEFRQSQSRMLEPVQEVFVRPLVVDLKVLTDTRQETTWPFPDVKVTDMTVTDLEMFKGLKCFLFVINILAAIAIIQFLSNFINIPRLEIVLSNHMVEGFNTGNYVYISNFVIMRSHSIFLEPSILSQYSAFAIVISLILYSYKIINKHFLISSLFLNSIAIICSISGTGLIILVLSIIIYFLKNFK